MVKMWNDLEDFLSKYRNIVAFIITFFEASTIHISDFYFPFY